MPTQLRRDSAIPFVAPFAVYIILMGIGNSLSLDAAWAYPARVLITAAVLLWLSPKITWRPASGFSSVAIGVAVFVLWIGPDVLWPAYRDHWLFQNSLTGSVTTSVGSELRSNTVFLLFRLIGAAVIVPIVEELFWRGWLMRYIVNPDFSKVALGTFSSMSFGLTAALFAVEHGPFWDVGLLAGVAYNLWMVRTRSLSDCILAHGLTNACLAAYVLLRGEWQYWL